MKKTILLLILGSNFSIFAQIINFSTNDTLIVDIINDPYSEKYLDLDFNGTNDVYIINNNTGSLWKGIEDSSDVAHKSVYYTGPGGNISTYQLLNMTDSTLSATTNWMEILNQQSFVSYGLGYLYNTNSSFVNENQNTRFYLGVRFYIQGTDLIYRPHYACIDLTLTQNATYVVHGWSYESQHNTPITCTESLLVDVTDVETLNVNYTKSLINIFDIMGRKTEDKPNTLLIYVFSDGSTEKVFRVE